LIIKIKAKEEVDILLKEQEDKEQNINAAEDYETLLRKEEAEIRQHISLEHQFKLLYENLSEKIKEAEKDNIILVKRIVSKYKIYKI
jgi:hypothetical protein